MLKYWKTVEEGIKRLRDVGMPARIYSGRAEGPEGFCSAGRSRGFIKVTSNVLMTRTAV